MEYTDLQIKYRSCIIKNTKLKDNSGAISVWLRVILTAQASKSPVQKAPSWFYQCSGPGAQLDGSGQEAFHHGEDSLWPLEMRGTQGFRELSHPDGAQEGLSRSLLHPNFLLRLSVKANKFFPSSTLESCGLFSSFQVHWESTRFFQTPLTMLARSPSGWFHPMWQHKTFQGPTIQIQSQKVREKSQSLWEKHCTDLLRSLLQGQGSSQEKDNVFDLSQRGLDIGKHPILFSGTCCIFLEVCVCVCVCEREREREREIF